MSNYNEKISFLYPTSENVTNIASITHEGSLPFEIRISLNAMLFEILVNETYNIRTTITNSNNDDILTTDNEFILTTENLISEVDNGYSSTSINVVTPSISLSKEKEILKISLTLMKDDSHLHDLKTFVKVVNDEYSK